jgi:hypothetical protein
VPDLDPGGLLSIIQPQHFHGETLAGYHSRLSNHPASLLVVYDFLAVHVAEAVGRFLERDVESRNAYGLYSREDQWGISPDEWHSAPDDDRLFKFGVFAEVRPEARIISPRLVAFLRLRSAFGDRRAAAWFEAVAARPLGALEYSVHWMRTGDFLRPHTDAIGGRVLAYVLFLSEQWDASFGGALHVRDASRREWVVEPTFNSLVVFDVTARSEHFVTPIEPRAGQRARVTLGGWVYEPESAQASLR